MTGFKGDSKSVWPERKHRKQQDCRRRVWGTKGSANYSQLEDKIQVPKGWELRVFKEFKKKKKERKKENGENRREKEKYVKENLCNLQNLKWLLPDPHYLPPESSSGIFSCSCHSRHPSLSAIPWLFWSFPCLHCLTQYSHNSHTSSS